MDTKQLSFVGHALSDPLRLRVLELLKGGHYSVNGMCKKLSVTQSRLSFHLKALKAAGLVSCRQEKQFSIYRLEADVIIKAAKAMLTLVDEGLAEMFVQELPNHIRPAQKEQAETFNGVSIN